MNETSTTLKSYITGFVLSILLVLAAYLDVTAGSGSEGITIGIIFGLAIIQVFVQLNYFLHIGIGSKSRLQLSILVFTAIGVGILVSGSIWIMYHLNYNMSPSQMNSIIFQEEGIQMPMNMQMK